MDFHVTDCGTLWRFPPLSQAAKDFCDEQLAIEGWQWLGRSFCVDHRPARALVDFIEAEGFSLA